MAQRKIETIPIIEIDVRIWKYLAVLYPTRRSNWRKYAIVLPVCFMNTMQFIYLLRMWGDLTSFILNLFYFATIFNAVMRTWLVIIRREHFEEFLMDLANRYWHIEASRDHCVRRILQKAVRDARRIAILNLTASFLDIVGALLFPLFSEQRVHPFGIALPTLDMTHSPIYEILYVLQIPAPVVLSLLYMPFILLYKLSLIGRLDTEQQRLEMLAKCIRYHSDVTRYIIRFNNLVTYMVGIEALIFNAIICSLLFCLNIITSPTQMISIVMYIFTMVYVLYTYYNRANDLVIESVKVSQAVFNVPWYECGPRFRKILLIFLMLTQRPLMIKVGNVYPMTLVMFQSLLNASYSYFTMLRGVTNK